MDESLRQVIFSINNDRQLIFKMVAYHRHLRNTGFSKKQSALYTLRRFDYIESD